MKLKLGIPKGSLEDATIQLFARAVEKLLQVRGSVALVVPQQVRELAARAADRIARERLDGWRKRFTPSVTVATSSFVNACIAPIENLPMRPVSFEAPRIVVCPGTSV